MLKAKYNSALGSAVDARFFWMGLAVLMIVSNLFLSVFVINADTSEKTIIVPTNIDQEFSITGSKVDPEYLEVMTRHFSGLLLTYHKDNSRFQFDTVLRHLDPLVYNELKKQFALEVDRIARNDIRSVFYLMGIHVLGTTVVIDGELNGYIGSQLVSQAQKRFEFKYTFTNKLYLSGYREVLKNSVGEYEAVVQFDEVRIDEEDLNVGQESGR